MIASYKPPFEKIVVWRFAVKAIKVAGFVTTTLPGFFNELPDEHHIHMWGAGAPS
jgi:hypothetical protein